MSLPTNRRGHLRELLTAMGVKEERELRWDNTEGPAKDGKQIYSGILHYCVILGLEQWGMWMIR